MNSPSQTIAMLGTGVVGIALARGFAARGDRVRFGTRAPEGEAARAAVGAVHGARAVSHIEAAREADLAVIALPWEAIAATLPELAGALAGKTVIDASNPLDHSGGGTPRLAIGHDDSAGEVVQRLLSAARVVKSFNIITSNQMVQPRFPDGDADMFIAGNDAAAKADVDVLLRDFGWRGAVDLGGIEQSRLLEPLAMVWITYGFKHNHWSHGFSLLGQTA